jgi:hypothetical protein
VVSEEGRAQVELRSESGSPVVIVGALEVTGRLLRRKPEGAPRRGRE